MLPTPQDQMIWSGTTPAHITILQIGPLVLGGGDPQGFVEGRYLVGYYHLMHRLTKSAGCGEWSRASVDALVTLIADSLVEQNTEYVCPYHLLNDDDLLEADRYEFEEQLEEHGGEIVDMEEEYEAQSSDNDE